MRKRGRTVFLSVAALLMLLLTAAAGLAETAEDLTQETFLKFLKSDYQEREL